MRIRCKELIIDPMVFLKLAENGVVSITSRSDGYLVARFRQQDVKLHRLIYDLCYGLKKNELIDHINGKRYDNRLENLRICDYQGNSRNKFVNSNCKSGFKGVSRTKGSATYFFRICNGNKREFKSGFKTAIAAAKAYDKRAAELFGEFAKTNKMMGLL